MRLFRFISICAVAISLLALAACQSPSSDVASNQPTPTATAEPSPESAAAASPTPGEVKISTSGLKYQDLHVGRGPRPLIMQSLKISYVGKFQDGHVFDKGLIDFTLGKDKMLKGWDWGIGGNSKEGIEPMRVGGKRIITVPPQLGYGSEPYGTIPGNSTLIFEVELIRINGGGF